MDLRQQQIQHEASRNGGLDGREFYVICPDNPNYFRTVFFKRNPFTGNLDTKMTNIIYGVPPNGIDEMPANLLSRLNCMNNPMPHSI